MNKLRLFLDIVSFEARTPRPTMIQCRDFLKNMTFCSPKMGHSIRDAIVRRKNWTPEGFLLAGGRYASLMPQQRGVSAHCPETTQSSVWPRKHPADNKSGLRRSFPLCCAFSESILQQHAFPIYKRPWPSLCLLVEQTEPFSQSRGGLFLLFRLGFDVKLMDTVFFRSRKIGHRSLIDLRWAARGCPQNFV